MAGGEGWEGPFLLPSTFLKVISRARITFIKISKLTGRWQLLGHFCGTGHALHRDLGGVHTDGINVMFNIHARDVCCASKSKENK